MKKPTPKQAVAAIVGSDETLANLNTVFNQFIESGQVLEGYWSDNTQAYFHAFMTSWAQDMARRTMAIGEQLRKQALN